MAKNINVKYIKIDPYSNAIKYNKIKIANKIILLKDFFVFPKFYTFKNNIFFRVNYFGLSS
jgi:hypothetical protein